MSVYLALLCKRNAKYRITNYRMQYIERQNISVDGQNTKSKITKYQDIDKTKNKKAKYRLGIVIPELLSNRVSTNRCRRRVIHVEVSARTIYCGLSGFYFLIIP